MRMSRIRIRDTCDDLCTTAHGHHEGLVEVALWQPCDFSAAHISSYRRLTGSLQCL